MHQVTTSTPIYAELLRTFENDPEVFEEARRIVQEALPGVLVEIYKNKKGRAEIRITTRWERGQELKP